MTKASAQSEPLDDDPYDQFGVLWGYPSLWRSPVTPLGRRFVHWGVGICGDCRVAQVLRNIGGDTGLIFDFASKERSRSLVRVGLWKLKTLPEQASSPSAR